MYAMFIHPGCLFARAGSQGIQFNMTASPMSSDAIRACTPAPLDTPLPQVLGLARPYRDAARRHHIAITQVHAPYPV